jgi:hypothetical protein
MKARPCPASEGGSGARIGNTTAVNKRPILIANGIGLKRDRRENSKRGKMVRRKLECRGFTRTEEPKV